MGTSGEMSTSNTMVKYSITMTTNWQDTVNNYSNVTVTVRFWRTNTGFETFGTGTCFCKIDGTTYSNSVTPSQKITNSGIILFNHTVNIPHYSDGSKDLYASAWISMDTPLTSNEQTYAEWLPNIQRASVITRCDSWRMEYPFSVEYTSYNPSFAHILVVDAFLTTETEAQKETDFFWAGPYYSGQVVQISDEQLLRLYKKQGIPTQDGYLNFLVRLHTFTDTSWSTQVGSHSQVIVNGHFWGTAKINKGAGVWHGGIPFLNANGSWKPCLAYINDNGTWKRCRGE